MKNTHRDNEPLCSMRWLGAFRQSVLAAATNDKTGGTAEALRERHGRTKDTAAWERALEWLHRRGLVTRDFISSGAWTKHNRQIGAGTPTYHAPNDQALALPHCSTAHSKQTEVRRKNMSAKKANKATTKTARRSSAELTSSAWLGALEAEHGALMKPMNRANEEQDADIGIHVSRAVRAIHDALNVVQSRAPSRADERPAPAQRKRGKETLRWKRHDRITKQERRLAAKQ